MRVDSHVHFWHYDEQEYDWISDGMEVLQQDYLPRHVARTLNRNGLDGCSCSGKTIRTGNSFPG